MADRDYLFADPPAPEVSCPSCSKVLAEPMELQPCQHLYCEGCVEQLHLITKGDEVEAECPKCGNSIDRVVRVRDNKGATSGVSGACATVLQKVDQLAVECLHCEWRGEFIGLEQHACTRQTKSLTVEESRQKGNALFVQGNFKEAILAYTEGIDSSDASSAKDKAVAILLLNRCWCHYKIEEYEESMEDAKRAVQLDPMLWKGYFRRGLAMKAMGSFSNEEIISQFEKAKSAATEGSDQAAVKKEIQTLRTGLSAPEWRSLGLNLGSETEKTTVQGKKYTRRQCFITSLEVDPTYLDGWCTLGSNFEHGTVTVNGRPYTVKGCYEEALSVNPRHAPSWFSIGSLVHTGGTFQIAGRSYSENDCYMRGFEIDPNNAGGWYLVGASLIGTNRTVTVNGKRYGERACYVRSVECDPLLSGKPWFNLGTDLQQGETVEVMGNRIGNVLCFASALKVDPQYTDAWINLGVNLGGGTTNVDGSACSAAVCFARALELDPTYAIVWCNLGSALNNAGGGTTTIHGKTVDATDCFVKSVEYDPTHAYSWMFLSKLLGSNESVKVGNKKYTQRSCRERATSLDPSVFSM